jgi:hypothetical protein
MPGRRRKCRQIQPLQGIKANILTVGVGASDGRFGGKARIRGDWQNLSIRLSESVIERQSEVGVTGDYLAEGH